MTYEFAVIAADVDPLDPEFENRFFDAGCNDATVSLQKGAIVLEFFRVASSLASAISTAVADVRRVGATVERIEPDPLVSLSDIAKRSGLTRAAISNYVSGERCEGFPPPVSRVMTQSPLWEWTDVACWLFKHGKVSDEVIADALILRQANDSLERVRLNLAAA